MGAICYNTLTMFEKRRIMVARTLAMFSLAAVAFAGCDGTGGGASSAKSSAGERSADPSLVAFDPAGVTNVSFSAGAAATLSYSALDGTGEWLWIFEPSEFSTVEDALAYVERVCVRCESSDVAILLPLYLNETRLPGGRNGDFTFWAVSDGLFLVVENAPGGTGDVAMFDFVFCDGQTMRRLAPFAALPASDRVWDSVRQARENPAALNNVAAMLFNDVGMRSAVSLEHIGFLLRMAAGAGDPIACRNMAVLCAGAPGDAAANARKRDFWLGRASKAVSEKSNGFAPALKARPLEDWPR